MLCRNLSGRQAHMPLVRECLATVSLLGPPLWTAPGLKSGTGVRKLISTLKKKKAQVGNGSLTLPPRNLICKKKATTTVPAPIDM